MYANRKWLLALLCVLCALLLTGCYTDRDPWPTAEELSATAIPATPTPTAVPTETPLPATPQPLNEDATDVSPNFNG